MPNPERSSSIMILEKDDTFNVVVEPELGAGEMLVLDAHGVVSGKHREQVDLPDGDTITLIRANDASLIGTRKHKIDDARELLHGVRDRLLELRGGTVEIVGKLALEGAESVNDN